MTPLTDSQRAAGDKLYRTYHPMLTNYIRLLTGNFYYHLRESAIHDAVISAVKNNAIGNAFVESTYLRVSVWREAIRQMNIEKKYYFTESPTLDLAIKCIVEAEHFTYQDFAARLLELEKQVECFTGALDLDHRVIFAMRTDERADYRKIAAKAGKSVINCRVIFAKTKRRLENYILNMDK